MLESTKKMFRLFLLIATLCVFSGVPGFAADFSEGTANFEVKFSDKFVYSNADFMLPLFESPESSAFFINPNAGFDLRLKGSSNDAERFGIGLGQRLYLPGAQFSGFMNGIFDKGVIIGWNGHLDTQYSMDDNFLSKVGLGAEFLSDWVDMRVNGYLRLTDDKSGSRKSHRYHYYGTGTYRNSKGKYRETLLSGVDTEFGLRLPVPDRIGEMRVFGGLYYFDASHVSSISGVTARFEWNPIPFMSLGVGWTNEEKLYGENWNAHLGFHLPFSFNALMSGHNPFSLDFTPKTGNLWHDRYTSSIRRNNF